MLDNDKIYCGDCIELMKEIDDNSVDLIVTDPPYLISYKTNYRIDKTHSFCSEIENDNNPEMIMKYIQECYRILKPDSAMYLFCSPNTVEIFKNELNKSFTIKNMIIWVKNNWTAGDLKGAFGKQYEIIFLVNKGRKLLQQSPRLTDVWFFDRVAGKKQLHQNEKPIDLLERCILYHSQKNDIVFDGMCGSGTTCIAAKNLNRHYIGMDISEEYCKISRTRLLEL